MKIVQNIANKYCIVFPIYPFTINIPLEKLQYNTQTRSARKVLDFSLKGNLNNLKVSKA